MLAAEFVRPCGKSTILGVGVDLAAFVVGGEGGLTVFQELLLPVVEELDGDALLLTEIGDRGFLQEMGPENGDLLLRGEGAALSAPECSSARVLPLTPAKANTSSG